MYCLGQQEATYSGKYKHETCVAIDRNLGQNGISVIEDNTFNILPHLRIL